MAENDQKVDPPFSGGFWQLEMPHARVLDSTIRSIEASKISSIVIVWPVEILKTVSFPRKVPPRESKILEFPARYPYVGRKEFKSRS